jgi:HAD superfamily hydrolase (TIGR01457 family)|tara:strand:+ start:2545 stop:3399 length:855 start_codon:yes stop_codon:yes gene_type:complete
MKMNTKQNDTIVFPKITERIGQLYDAYLLDLDGTVLLGNKLIPGAEKVIKTLRNLERRVVFISNNSTSSPESYAKQLTLLGIPTINKDVINSSMVLIDFLNNTIPQGRLLVIGEPELCNDLEASGFYVTNSESNVDAVIVSFDRNFNYQKLQASFDAIKNGARFFATNSDKYRPVLGGGQPDAGAIIAAIESCTEKSCEVIVGKPSHHTINYLTSRVVNSNSKCIIVGDRPETDIQMGINASIDSALVLTGVTKLENAITSQIKPTYIINSILHLLPDKILNKV